MQVSIFNKADSTELLLPIIAKWLKENNGSDFNIPVDVGEAIDDFLSFVESPDADLLVLKDSGKIIGLMGMHLMKNPTGKDIWANENYWYVIPEYRKGRGAMMLFNYSRQWARDKGATKELRTASYMASDKHSRVCRLYENKGLKKLETTYIGDL